MPVPWGVGTNYHTMSDTTGPGGVVWPLSWWTQVANKEQYHVQPKKVVSSRRLQQNQVFHRLNAPRHQQQLHIVILRVRLQTIPGTRRAPLRRRNIGVGVERLLTPSSPMQCQPDAADMQTAIPVITEVLIQIHPFLRLLHLQEYPGYKCQPKKKLKVFSPKSFIDTQLESREKSLLRKVAKGSNSPTEALPSTPPT